MIPQADDVESLSMVGRSREERLEMFMNTFNDEFKACWDSDDAGVDPHTGRRPMKFRDFASHQLDMIETDGFDMQDCSEFDVPGTLVRLYDPPKILANAKCVTKLQDCSCEAIIEYNKKHGTHYSNVCVLKANSEPLAPCRYYITFQATDRKRKVETFQARVNICFSEFRTDVKFEKEVELVRIKTAPKPFCYS
ncbi:hypothetical protein ACET3Z_001346 [Daucus carota]